ncbi:MAG: DUF4492 domain-containing protein [Muribaculaceae bacterium]|nr:DUF4492 domain-containing protein [Muribaculaceae bacterium]
MNYSESGDGCVVRKIKKIFFFYRDGFREMTVGKTLWAIILVKLFIMFFVLKLFFFPNLLSRDYDTDEERANHVRHELTERGR